MTTNETVLSAPATQAKAKPKRELQDFKTHTVIQSLPEVAFWALAVAVPLSVFVHPVVGLIAGIVVARQVALKNLFRFRVGKDDMTLYMGLNKQSTVKLKNFAAVECHLSVRGEGIDEGCVDGEGTLIITYKDGVVIRFEKVLRVEKLCDVILKRRDWKPMPRNVRPAR